jgi:(E)-benzylidenesuccinyl-CoA hydratase
VIYKKQGRIAYITINRPSEMNAINDDVIRGLCNAWIAVHDDPDVWIAIVTGAGDKSFSAGADLKNMSLRNDAAAIGSEFPPRPVQTPMRGLEVWKPIIAAINGYCFGGGLELALACDIRIAASHAVFGLPEVTRGIIPGGGGTQRLPRMMPFTIALEYLMTGERLTAEEALKYNLVTRIVPAEELMSAAEALAAKINQNGPVAVRIVKEAAYKGIGMPLADGLRLEESLLQKVLNTKDAKEGPRAFVEKRRPVYKGC